MVLSFFVCVWGGGGGDIPRSFEAPRLVTLLEDIVTQNQDAGPRSAVGNVSGYRCEADCRSRGRELDPGPVPYFRGD